MSKTTQDAIDEPDDINEYREASLKLLGHHIGALAFIIDSASHQAAAWAVAYAEGLTSICGEMPISSKAAELGMSPQALSKLIRKYRNECNLPESQYMHHKKS
jgi:hypothetical protein